MIMIFTTRQSSDGFVEAVEGVRETGARLNAALSDEKKRAMVTTTPEVLDYVGAVTKLVGVLADAKVQTLNA